MRKFGIMGCFFAALAGCVAESSVEAAPADVAHGCGADQLQYLVGKSKTVLEAMRFSQPLRVIGPGDAVTMDHRPDRLNILTDASGTIIGLRCG